MLNVLKPHAARGIALAGKPPRLDVFCGECVHFRNTLADGTEVRWPYCAFIGFNRRSPWKTQFDPKWPGCYRWESLLNGDTEGEEEDVDDADGERGEMDSEDENILISGDRP